MEGGPREFTSTLGRGRAATLVSRTGEGVVIVMNASALTRAGGATSPEGRGIGL